MTPVYYILGGAKVVVPKHLPRKAGDIDGYINILYIGIHDFVSGDCEIFQTWRKPVRKGNGGPQTEASRNGSVSTKTGAGGWASKSQRMSGMQTYHECQSGLTAALFPGYGVSNPAIHVDLNKAGRERRSVVGSVSLLEQAASDDSRGGVRKKRARHVSTARRPTIVPHEGREIRSPQNFEFWITEPSSNASKTAKIVGKKHISTSTTCPWTVPECSWNT
ncbi:hypothetical protein GGX14DRAFT_405720 [Mycena pura]|uniref:Uncharacterized protein n=1 Tax=Mycena pura TaxID=153505 RepID=A0AAD6URT1_9AGAR|nr:hypothetical protein GGX14DRAFT_405720 [Mycena pura]